jgi:5'(3')-deoxyribonucleotidase
MRQPDLHRAQGAPTGADMRIGVDFDSTLAKIDQPLLNRLNAIRGTAYRAEEWSDWSLSFLPPEERDLLFRLFTPDLYDEVLPYRGAREAIQSLLDKPDIDLVCVTSNPERQGDVFMEAKNRWLRRHVPELSDRLIAAANKYGLGLDLLIDDAPHHHRAADCTMVLVERPWNQDVHCALRFSDWEEGKGLLNRLILQRNRKE